VDKDEAKRIRNLTPDTLCTFSPDPSEQQDARWLSIDNDEDMETNVLYAVASPGVLKLWPWVNQVCYLLQHNVTLFLTNANQTPLTVTSKLPLEVVMQLFKRMGYVATFTSQRFLFLFLTDPLSLPFLLAHVLSSWRTSAYSLGSQQSRTCCT
jgi:hypothetical protein